MGKTFKDRKDYPKYRKAKQEPLKQEYVAYLKNGPPSTDHVAYSYDDEYFLEDEGEHCPCCGKETDFECGFLVCGECGWIDAGPESIVPEAA